MTLNRWLIACAASLALCSTTLAALSLNFAASGATSATTSATNGPPTISGPTSGSAAVGRPFSLRPSASDPDGDRLTFSIANRPAWASFDPATGVLFGTPQATNVGVYGSIRISVSDGTHSVSLPAITVTVSTQPLNAPPLISGPLTGDAVVGRPFSLRPHASDPDGDPLTFSVTNLPSWASFDPASGVVFGTPQATDIGVYGSIRISVSDGTYSASLPAITVTVAAPPRKAHYGHYFATRYADTPADAAMLCEQPGVSGVVWRQTWQQVEPAAGVYDFSSFDQVLTALAASANPGCQLWLLVEYKSFANSPVKNPCPVYLQAQHSGLNSTGNGAATCFMWEPEVMNAYVDMMWAAAARFDHNPRVEGLILQESSLSLNGAYAQDLATGGTYTPTAWRDALITLIGQCSTAFANSRCMAFLNFLRGGQALLNDVSAAISAIPDNQACFSGPDVLPNSPALYRNNNRVYEVLTRHSGCRSNSIQNDSYQVPGCALDCIFHFAVSGSFGDFPETAPLSGGLCINSYLFWNHRATKSTTGQDWTDALPVIAANPYGPGWYLQCAGGGGAP
jgi:hypothetical protein